MIEYSLKGKEFHVWTSIDQCTVDWNNVQLYLVDDVLLIVIIPFAGLFLTYKEARVWAWGPVGGYREIRNTGCLVNHQHIGCTSAAAAAAMDYYACQVKTEIVSREPKAWCLRPEDKVIVTSFDHVARRTIIASSTVKLWRSCSSLRLSLL